MQHVQVRHRQIAVRDTRRAPARRARGSAPARSPTTVPPNAAHHRCSGDAQDDRHRQPLGLLQRARPRRAPRHERHAPAAAPAHDARRWPHPCDRGTASHGARRRRGWEPSARPGSSPADEALAGGRAAVHDERRAVRPAGRRTARRSPRRRSRATPPRRSALRADGAQAQRRRRRPARRRASAACATSAHAARPSRFRMRLASLPRAREVKATDAGRQGQRRWRPSRSGSPGRTRTSDQSVNSRSLYRLSYRGMRQM